MRSLYILFLPLLLSEANSFAQSREEIIKHRIEKVVITRKFKFGDDTRTRIFDTRGNLIHETFYAENKSFDNIEKTKREIIFFYKDTTCIKITYYEMHISGKEEEIYNETTMIRYVMGPSGLIDTMVQVTNNTDTTKNIYHYNRKGLLDTLCVCVNDSARNYQGYKYRPVFLPGYFILRKNVYTYDSLNRMTSDMSVIPKYRERGPFLYKFSYNADTVLQNDYHYEDSVLVFDSSFTKTYSAKNYIYQAEHFDTTETFIQRNAAGLIIKEKVVNRHRYNGNMSIDTYYKYFYKPSAKTALKKNYP